MNDPSIIDDIMSRIDRIMNAQVPTRDERTAARLQTLGLILPTHHPLIRTDLPPRLILITHPNGLLGSEPIEREHAWWETPTPLDELIRAENRRKARLPMVICHPEDEARLRAELKAAGLEDRVSLSSSSFAAEFLPPGEVWFYDPRPFLDEQERLVFAEPGPRRYWVPSVISPSDIVSITGVC